MTVNFMSIIALKLSFSCQVDWGAVFTWIPILWDNDAESWGKSNMDGNPDFIQHNSTQILTLKLNWTFMCEFIMQMVPIHKKTHYYRISTGLNFSGVPPLLLNFHLKTYPNLTACSSGPEARICIFLVSFERKHSEFCGNVNWM